MIGYYVHHHGRGHLHRALEVGRALVATGRPVTFLSSLPAPADSPGDWVELERDDCGAPANDPTARGHLHWVPLGDAGLSARTRQISAWLDGAHPDALVVDVSVEVALLARLHGVRVVGVVVPGERTDPAHRWGLGICDAIVGAWPPAATVDLLPGLPPEVSGALRAVGALSRFPVEDLRPRRPGPPRVVVLGGAGGSEVTSEQLAAAAASAAGWVWTVLGPGSWASDPRPALREADVVVTHAGQNALAEVAALRRPAIVVPQPRPHDEQVTTARALAAGPWPALVEPAFPVDGWTGRLAAAADMDGRAWSTWCDGRGAARFADVVAEVA